MTHELTVKEYAERERVHERTVRRWIAKGAVEVRRTPGGGLRIETDGSVLVLRASDMSNADNSGHLFK